MRELFLVVRVLMVFTTPATVTYWLSEKLRGPSSPEKSPSIAPICTAPIRLAVSRYSSIGWPVRYRPVISFSMAMSSRGVYSVTCGMGMVSAFSLSPGSSPKRSIWPETLSRSARLMLSRTAPAICMSALRL